MKPRSKLRTTIKWSALVVMTLLLGVWIASAWWTGYWVGHGWAVWLDPGGVAYVESPEWRTNDGPDYHVLSAGKYAIKWKWWYRCTWSQYVRIIFIPFWLPALLTATIAAVAWRIDTIARRRAQTNHCPACNYNRTGLPSPATPCLECGHTPIAWSFEAVDYPRGGNFAPAR